MFTVRYELNLPILAFKGLHPTRLTVPKPHHQTPTVPYDFSVINFLTFQNRQPVVLFRIFSYSPREFLHLVRYYRPGLANLWHTTFTAVPIIFISVARRASIYYEGYACIHMCIYDCVEIIHELSLLPNRYVSLGRQHGGDRANT